MTSSAIRILHVFGRMGRGGAETWLMNVLRQIDRQRYQFDFLVHRERAGEFDDEIRALGGTIHKLPSHRQPVRYVSGFRSVLQHGRYDIVHGHVSHFTGFALSLARLFGVAGRIAHSHTAGATDDNAWPRRVYKRSMRELIHRNATLGVGCSSQACAGLFGADWQRHDKYQRLFYGYDFDRFAVCGPGSRAAARAELGLSDDQLCIGHVGRFSRPKNHDFMIELMTASKAAGRVDQRFVFIGDGELRADFEHKVASRDLGDKAILTGLRRDIPELLSSIDVLILPSLWEGLPVTILEAQAAGVPAIMSDRVSSEVILADDVRQLPLSDPRSWLATVDELASGPRKPASEALAQMTASPFGIAQHVRAVQEMYERERSQSRWS